MRWILFVFIGLFLLAGVDALARVVPVAYGSGVYIGPSNVYAGGYVASPYGISVGVNLPNRVMAFNASPTVFGYRVSGAIYRKPALEFSVTQDYPRHGYWHGEGDHVYIYNRAYPRSYSTSQGANGYPYRHH